MFRARFKIILRIVPKQWTHGLRDNEFAQRILVQRFSDLASNRNNAMIDSIKNLLCVVDERYILHCYRPCSRSGRMFVGPDQLMTNFVKNSMSFGKSTMA